MIDKVIEKYFPENKGFYVKSFGNGHINDTYKVELAEYSSDYILQRINTSIFKTPDIIIENHLKLQNELTKKNHAIEIARLIHDDSGKYLFTDKEGSAWRVTEFIKDSCTINVVEENWQAYQAGLGYGWFVNACRLLNPDDFREPIKDFHKLSFRLNQLKSAIKENKVNRLNSVQSVVQFFNDREDALLQIENLIEKGDIPLRVVHNDTKINNILFRNKRAVAVIDLDTVGPGSILYDYGDALRTSANNAVEDEKILERVSFNLDSFKAFTEGYILPIRNILTEKELVYLHKAPVLMTYIIGIRFLADYLNGDVYYKTSYDEHNLDRCKVQVKLIESMEKNEEFIKKTIENCLV